ncbi:MAG TPA: hypothetical protein DCR95_00115 [Desulfobacter sp.]|uniref:hypothetical protein n=1 Tax=Desulfobacter sp. UBA2225 TaxID=1961413 RepID=UPI000E8AEFE6|nr:hypothetical protein [Desulfobacter sp. UBA2225]HAR32535.1 hypothetical protein [Desulfobacter sp.]
MEKQDIKAFTDIMLAIADNYPGATFTSAGLKLRFEALKEFSIDQVSEAAVKLIRDHKYNTMPTTADIIEAMGGKISVKDRAEIEAGKVLDHLHRYGKGVIPEFEDTITQYLMSTRWRYGSWAAYVAESDLKWWFRDFVRAYQAHAAGIGLDCLLHLPGLKQLAGQGKETTYAI